MGVDNSNKIVPRRDYLKLLVGTAATGAFLAACGPNIKPTKETPKALTFEERMAKILPNESDLTSPWHNNPRSYLFTPPVEWGRALEGCTPEQKIVAALNWLAVQTRDAQGVIKDSLVWKELEKGGTEGAKCVHYVQALAGLVTCKNGLFRISHWYDTQDNPLNVFNGNELARLQKKGNVVEKNALDFHNWLQGDKAKAMGCINEVDSNDFSRFLNNGYMIIGTKNPKAYAEVNKNFGHVWAILQLYGVAFLNQATDGVFAMPMDKLPKEYGYKGDSSIRGVGGNSLASFTAVPLLS